MNLIDELRIMLKTTTVVNKKPKALIPQMLEQEPKGCVIVSFLNGLINLELLNVRKGNDLLNEEFKELKMKGTDYAGFIIKHLPETGHAKRVESNTVEWDYNGKKALIKHFLLRDNNDKDVNNLKESLEHLAANKGAIIYLISDDPVRHAGLAYGINYKDKGKVLAYDPIKGYKTEKLEDFIKKLEESYLLIKEKT